MDILLILVMVLIYKLITMVINKIVNKLNYFNVLLYLLIINMNKKRFDYCLSILEFSYKIRYCF